MIEVNSSQLSCSSRKGGSKAVVDTMLVKSFTRADSLGRCGPYLRGSIPRVTEVYAWSPIDPATDDGSMPWCTPGGSDAASGAVGES